MKKVIVYTMKGCPWCLEMKNTLKEHNNTKTIIKLKKDLQNTREDLNKHMVQRNKK